MTEHEELVGSFRLSNGVTVEEVMRLIVNQVKRNNGDPDTMRIVDHGLNDKGERTLSVHTNRAPSTGSRP